MTKKEELERSKKNNKIKNTIIFILVIVLIILLAVFLFKDKLIKPNQEETSVDEPTYSDSDNIDDYQNDNDLDITSDNTEAAKSEEENENSSSDKSSVKNEDESESENINNGSVYSASLPLTVDDALDILNSRYGNGYRINSSTSGEGYTNFAVFKDDERFATVRVNLSTGDAAEMIIESGKETKFNLLKGE